MQDGTIGWSELGGIPGDNPALLVWTRLKNCIMFGPRAQPGGFNQQDESKTDNEEDLFPCINPNDPNFLWGQMIESLDI